MAIDSANPSSRRTLLAGALGGLAAAVAGTLGRAQPARAHDPDDVRLGAANSTIYETQLINTSTNVTALLCLANGEGHGVSGQSTSGDGVFGTSKSGDGVAGGSTSGRGVYGQSISGSGVHGSSPSGIGVSGDSDSGTAVSGFSATGNGIYGASGSASTSGVVGVNIWEGNGVAGQSNSRPLGTKGVFSAATLGDNTADGIGVWGRSAHGTGIFAEAINPDAVALRANGVTRFARSGRLTIKAGAASATKTGIRIDAGTLVLATLQQDRAGVYIRSAVPNAAGNSFTVRLNEAVGSDTKVGWFLVN
jgi:hypothetical protein